jgi:uncharacterized protein (TIGR02268 family)
MHEVQVSPGLSTTLFFDSELEQVELQEQERFLQATPSRDGLSLPLRPSRKVHAGERLRLTVRFKDGAAPTRVDFLLVVHPALAERQVDVLRHPRSVDSMQTDLVKTREENAQLRAENEWLRAQRDLPDGLTGLLHSRAVDKSGITCWWGPGMQRPERALQIHTFLVCRARGQVVVRVEVASPAGESPWTAQGAKLTGPKGEELKASVWQPKPVAPGATVPLFIELPAKDLRTAGPFFLKLWEAEGPRTVTLSNITFPELREVPGP